MEAVATLIDGARAVLGTADAAAKARVSRQTAELWRAGKLAPPDPSFPTAAPPERPARSERPVLLAPRDMPKRGRGFTGRGRLALLHALAHIELNAIDLAWDIIARFPAEALPQRFFDDWVAVGDDEARHFLMLNGRLADLGARYGDLPAHDGLWQAAEETRHDILARLAVVPMVLEARGLDVTPAMMARLEPHDPETARLLDIIYGDEINHVAAGRRWFEHICDKRDIAPEATFHVLVRRHFKGRIKAPFNVEARSRAGLRAAYYAPLEAAAMSGIGSESP